MRFTKSLISRPSGIGFPAILSLTLLIIISSGCNERPTDRVANSSIQGVLKWHSDCKANERAFLGDLDADHECIIFSYDGQDTLFLTHYNTAFNCCPDSLLGAVSIDGNRIIITETETFGNPRNGCHCLCLYDLEYIITGLEPGNYELKINSPYHLDNDAPFEFDLDLTGQTFAPVHNCLFRDHYPWGAISEQPVNILRVSECGGFGQDTYIIPFPIDNEECLLYDFNGAGLLTILHENILFNCCLAGMAVRTEITGNDLYIYEEEVLDNGGCDCICDYDLEYTISDLTLPYYNVTIAGGYHFAPQMTPLFQFMLVTTSPVSDTICLLK